MAVLQLNPVGAVSTDEGYISSITVRSSGSATVLTPDGSNQITCSAQAATRLIGGMGANTGGTMGTAIKLVTG